MAFTPKWSREVRAAVLYAILDLGHTAPAALRLAERGELPQLKPGEKRLDPVEGIPLGTVRDWARDERQRRASLAAASAAPDTVLAQTRGRLAQLWEREVSRAEVLSRRGKLEPDRIAKLARAGIEISRLNGARVDDRGQGGTSAPSTPDAAPDSFIDGLAAEPDSET